MLKIGRRENTKINNMHFSVYEGEASEIRGGSDTLVSLSRWSTDDEVDQGLRRGTSISQQVDLIVGEYLGMKRLEALER